MGSVLSNTFKTVYTVLFLLSFIYVILNIDTNNLFDFSKLQSLLDYLIAIFQVIATSFGTIIFDVVVALMNVLSVGVTIPYLNFPVSLPFANFSGSLDPNPGQLLNNLLVGIFPKSSTLINIEDPNQFAEIFLEFIQVWSVAIAFVLLPAILLSFLGFIVRGEARLAIISFISLQLLIVLSMYTPSPDTPTGRMMLLDLTFPSFTGTVESIIPDFLALVSTPIFLLGILLYLLLEIAFQTSYAINVVDPMIERENRIKEHLKRIDSFQPQPEKDKKAKAAIIQTNKKYDIVAASYLREMVERKLFKKGQQLDQKTTLRLQSFINSTRKTDRNFVNKITAKSAQPNTSALLFNAIPSIIIRVLVVIFISFFIVNPTPITDIMISNPLNPEAGGIIAFPQLAESLELTQPEFRTVIIFNIVLLIIFISAVAHWLLVNRPEEPEKHVKKVDTLVEFQDIKEATAVTED